MFNSIFRFLIKNLVLKFYKEALTFFIFSGVILFAISSLGFSNENSTQFNKELWLSALLNYNRNINPGTQPSNQILDNNKAVISKKTVSENTLKEFNIFDPSSFTIPKDTIPTDTSIISDTSKTVTPRNLFDTTKIDTGKVDTILNDTSRVIDTLRRDTISVKGKVSREDSLRLDRWGKDSTARLEHFKYYREDRPYTTLKNYKPSSFFVTPSENIRRKVIEIDSTGKFVEIKEIVAGKPAKIILRMPISEYVALKMELREREMWEKLGYEYQLKEGKKGLSELIKDITDFEIPLPSVGVLSIFGEPKIRLNIGGAVDITGAWRNETTEGITANRLGNTRNEPNFNQKVQINVNGTIGDKLNISADWNTERTFEYENQLKIKYTGYEDEIIQSIEAGNVSLQTSPLVGGSEALFGIKGQFRLGPLTLTALASQKKGETKEQTLSSGGTTQPFTIRAYDYSKNHYFIDTIYANSDLWNSFYGNPTPEYNSALYVVDIEVWKSTTALNPQNERSVNAYIDLPPVGLNGTYDPSLKQPVNGGDGKIETGRFIKLDASDFEIQRETGRLTFKTNVQETDIIAVAYRLQNGPGPEDDQFYGEFSTGTNKEQTLVLKLVKPKNLQPQYTQAWRLQLKNIYGIQGRDVKKEGFEFFIKRDIAGSDPVSNEGSIRFLEAFGLDKYNATQQSTPDGVFDFDPGITIIPSTGEIIFPVLEPFGRDIPEGLDSLAWPSIYTSTINDARRDQTKDKWLLTGKYSGSVSSKFNLGFNVVQNSVKVKLNGSELTAGVDYIVDYNVGELIIRNDAALNPGADLKITYEENDLLQLASKTLVGARGLFDFTEKTKLGFSILNLNQETLNDKVRIGEEPLSNTIYGLDFQHSSDLPFITKGLDKYYSTKEASSFSLSGEYAYINPDPNTKKSTILSDRNRSIAYIDDFEGAKRVIPIGVSYTQWKDISIPDHLSALDTITDPFRKLFHKGKSFWFTITPSTVTVDDIWAGRKQSSSKNDDNVSVLDFVFRPDTPGTYNYNPDTLDITRSWGGMQKILSSTANNLIEEHIEFIEFWINVPTAPPGAKMYLDLGRISEDVYPNRELNTEDLPPRNDAIDPEGKEDVGFDNMNNDQERAFAAQRGYPTATSPDPSNDDFGFSTGRVTDILDYYNINGLEGNAKLSDIGRLPDTEDLNRNNTIDLTNSYFRYEVPLDTANNPFISGGISPKGWFLIRIPLKDSLLGVGNPQFTNVETIRMFITGVAQPVHLRLAEFNLVGSQWEKQIPVNGQLAMDDEVLSISVVNLEDNPEYKSPAGVIQERDRSKPDEEILKNEQSLNLILNGLPAGDKREAVKNLYRELDVFNYKEMKLFIHGDENTSAQSISVDSTAEFYNSEVFFRFGSDSNNYYEYRQPVRSGWNEISILFEKLTAIKQSRSDSVNLITRELVEGTKDHFYLIKGNPTLTRIKFLSVGVFNATAERGDPTYLSGSVWVNELRVIGADDSPGWAYQVNSSIKMADLLTVNMNLSQQNPFFHRLAERFGSRVDSRNWGISADLDVLKLIPTRMAESNLRIQYSHTESVGNPLYLPGTDIKVSEAQKQLQEPNTGKGSSKQKTPEQLEIESQSINTSDSYNASGIKIKIPSNYWLIRDTWNALTFNFNYNKSFSRNPNTERADYWIWNAGITYGINLSPEYYFMPVKIPIIGSIIGLLDDYKNLRIYYAPSVFAADMNARRSRNTMVTRELQNAPSQYTVTRDFGATRGFNFTWKVTEGGFLNLTTNYSVDATSSLAHLETDEFGMQRKESKIWKDIFTGVIFGNDIDFVQVVDLKSSPKLPSFLGNYFTLTAGYSVNYSWRNDLKSTLGRSAGYANKTNLSMNLKLKSLVAPWFKEETTVDTKNQQQQPQQQTIKRGRDRNLDIQDPNKKDTSVVAVDSTKMQDSLDNKPKQSAITGALKFLKNIAYITLFDYETISMNYTNDNSLRKSGLYGGGTGFANFWGAKFKDEYGPSRGFIFGLGGDVGRRAPGGNVSDNASYRNNLDFRTSKPLWEGARIELNWKIGWTMNKNVTLRTDEFGNGSITNINSTGTISRSFLSVPPFMIFSFLKSGIKRVHEIDPTGDNLSSSFVEGFETLPLLSKIGFLKDIAKYIPRPNWKVSWNGLEKLFFFKWAKTVSFDHAYSSNLQEGWKLTPGVGTEVQSQKIDYGFAPLIGLNFNFGEVWGGNFTANTKYNVRTGFSLNATNVNITEDFSRDFGITANYSKSGFEIPLFGISLKNDIEFMFSYSMGKNSEVQYNMKEFTEEGIPQSGSTRTTIEPRIRYTISSKVNLTLFYKRTSVEPEAGSSIIGTTTNEGGLEVHISIQ